jgi:hypothetical protein
VVFALRILILLVIGIPVAGLVAQDPQLSQIQAAVDTGSSRTNIRDAILKITPDPVPALICIVSSKDEPEFRRRRAIALLGTFHSDQSEHALDQLTDDPEPFYRCLALQSLVELKSRIAVPVLIRKLDDPTACMTQVSTDPAEEHDVYVSDEAVRLLEDITGRSFEREPIYGHRKTKPWKKWWAKQKKSPPKSRN